MEQEVKNSDSHENDEGILLKTEPRNEDKGLRLRRTKSVGRAEQISQEEAKARSSQPDKPCHRPRDSLFSWTSNFDNFTGFVNWAFLLLLVGGVRLFLENFLKYGIRVDPLQWLIVLNGGSLELQQEYPTLLLVLYLNVPILFTLWLEKALAKDRMSCRRALYAHVFNLIHVICLPIVVINWRKNRFGLVGATYACMVYTIVFLKLWSYIHVQYWCRLERGQKQARHARRRSYSFHQPIQKMALESKPTVVNYPNNLNVKDIYSFMFLPTLCYELNFPRTARIRKRFLVKRIVETVIGFQVVLGLFQQWIIPSVKNSLIPFSKMEVIPATERLLKLAVPNHLIWLIWFYLFFHSFLNLLGEVFRFADREFYLDWWNANNLDVFWRSWNMPAHRWAVRHLYMPILKRGYSKTVAALAVFVLSAFFHEFLLSVPLRMWKVWAFTGMMAQIPLSMISQWAERRLGPRWGNLLMWMSLILGQPLCIMMYYHDFVIAHFGPHLLQQFGQM